MKVGRMRILWMLAGVALVCVALAPVSTVGSETTSMTACDLGVATANDQCAGATAKGTYDPNSSPPCGGAPDDCGSKIAY